MKIDRSTKLEDEAGNTCELDLVAEGVSIRTKNGKPFIVPTVEDFDQLIDALFDVKGRLEQREEEAAAAAAEKPNPTKAVKASTKAAPAAAAV